MRVPAAWAPVYVFVLWSESRRQQQRILTDLGETFTLLDVVEVTWSPDDTFARSLTRMYGDALPPGSDKELHCGTGPFLAVVVQDRRPVLRPRRTSKSVRLLNSRVHDARRRYREWTGGGYRVHASDSVLESDRNLVLILGETSHDVRGRRPVPDGPRPHPTDPVGTDGWSSIDQLLKTLRPYGARLCAPPATDRLTVAATDVWWAEHIAGGKEVRAGVREVQVVGRPLELAIRPSGCGPVRRLLDRAGAILSR